MEIKRGGKGGGERGNAHFKNRVDWLRYCGLGSMVFEMDYYLLSKKRVRFSTASNTNYCKVDIILSHS